MNLADVHASLDAQGAMKLIGAHATHVRESHVELEVDYRAEGGQQGGFFHAGIMAPAVDSAGGYAAYSMMPPGARVLSTEFKLNFLRPAKGEKVVCIGKVIRAGKTLTVCDLKVWVEAVGERKLCVKGMQTCICLAAST